LISALRDVVKKIINGIVKIIRIYIN